MGGAGSAREGRAEKGMLSQRPGGCPPPPRVLFSFFEGKQGIQGALFSWYLFIYLFF
jgi:hypothetical protein